VWVVAETKLGSKGGRECAVKIERLPKGGWPPPGENYFMIEPSRDGTFSILVMTVTGSARNEARFIVGLRSQDDAIAAAENLSDKYNTGVIYLKDELRSNVGPDLPVSEPTGASPKPQVMVLGTPEARYELLAAIKTFAQDND